MEELRRGEVMIANWHRLAKKETNTVNGDSAKVVKTGEPVEVVKNAGKANESVEIKYFESDASWFKRVRRELGSGKGRSPHWLIFNDEAHTPTGAAMLCRRKTLDEDKDLARKNAREATIWIEGLDRINRLAGGSRDAVSTFASICPRPLLHPGVRQRGRQAVPLGRVRLRASGRHRIRLSEDSATPGSRCDRRRGSCLFQHLALGASQGQGGWSRHDITPEIVMNYASAPIICWHRNGTTAS